METDEFISSDAETSDSELESLDYPRRYETSLALAVRAAVKQEDDVIDFLKHVLIVFRQSSTALVCRTLATFVAIIVFIVGILRFRQCPYEQELPLFLVLEGVAIILKSCLGVLNSCNKKTDENERNTLTTLSDILTLFVVLWTLTGSVWTFGIFRYVGINSPDESQYCDWLVFTCSFVLLVTIYSCVLAFLIVTAVLSMYYCYKNDGDKKQLPYEIHVQR